jgi:hypothetical protein
MTRRIEPAGGPPTCAGSAQEDMFHVVLAIAEVDGDRVSPWQKSDKFGKFG